MAETGGMISRAVPEVPKDPTKLRDFLRKILRQHYQDIKTLFDTTTDCDQYEKLQRDNEQG